MNYLLNFQVNSFKIYVLACNSLVWNSLGYIFKSFRKIKDDLCREVSHKYQFRRRYNLVNH